MTEYDGVIARSLDATARTWSVSQFTQIGQCAFRWFASKVLRLELPDEAVNEIDRRTLGSFYHKVLELAVEPLLGRADIRSAVIAGLDDAFTAAEADTELNVTSLPNWDKLRNDHLRILRRTVNSEDFVQEGAVILELEKEFEGEWEDLPMQGFIDRIDETPTDFLPLITRPVPRPRHQRRGRTFKDRRSYRFTHTLRCVRFTLTRNSGKAAIIR